MWFKNLHIFRMTQWNITSDELEQKLANRALQECLSMEFQSRGWVYPKEDAAQFVHSMDQHLLITLGIEKKLLPASVINQKAKERAAELAQIQGYEPGRKQLKEIKEHALVDLLPRAFTLRQKTSAWIDSQDGWLVIDTPSTSRAEEFLEVFIHTISDITLKPLKTNQSPVAAMTAWLSAHDAPACFTIDRHCELRARDDEKSTVNYVRHNLDSPEIRRHGLMGKEVTRLAMTWNDKISFMLHENLQLKRITPLDILKEPVEEMDMQFDSDFAMMTGELKQLLVDLTEALGGAAGV